MGVRDTGPTEVEQSCHRHSVQTPDAARVASPPPATRPPPPSPWEPTDGGDPPATSLRRGEATVTFPGAVGAAAPRAGRAFSRPPRASDRPQVGPRSRPVLRARLQAVTGVVLNN